MSRRSWAFDVLVAGVVVVLGQLEAWASDFATHRQGPHWAEALVYAVAGAVRMVDVSDKATTAREAVARGRITMSREAIQQIRSGAVKKGDPLQAARLAGIMAAKQTSSVIPLCHPLPLSHAGITLTPLADGYDIEARVRTTAQTGVEMEALHAVAVAALTIYDMIKAVDKRMVIGDIRLVEKRGGQSGDFQR